MSRARIASFLALAALVALPAAASAGVVFSTGNTPGGDNVVFNPCASEITTGTTVTGCLNDQQSLYVSFTGNETLLVNGGQARIESTDGSFTFLSIAMSDTTLGFTQIVFNVNTFPETSGDITITANLFAPASPASVTSSSFALGNGQNFFTVATTGSDVMSSLSFTATNLSSVLFQDTRQVRLAVTDASGTPVSEPGSVALLAVALAGMGLAARRRRA